MSLEELDSRRIRAAMQQAIPFATSEFGRGLPASWLYFPSPHRKSCQWDVSLVVGDRGSGKSTLFLGLQSDEFRKVGNFVGYSTQEGFGEKSAQVKGLDTKVLGSLREFPPEIVWRTLIISGLWDESPGGETWVERVRFVDSNWEAIQARLAQFDESLGREGRRVVVLFDALDRTGDCPQQRSHYSLGLLKETLRFCSFSRLRLKLFVRPDMLEPPEVRAFPDSSKVLSNQVHLNWEVEALYCLLWQRLANSEAHGVHFREQTGLSWEEIASVFPVPLALQRRQQQETLFSRLAGSRMGEALGVTPYSWLANHLRDAHRRVSPRSFLQALGEAADQTSEKFPDCPFALDWRALRLGIKRASTTRIEELAEDHAWILEAMRPLRGIRLPCPIQELPQIDIEELSKLGICYRMPGDLLNVPDIYRLGFGLRRKGAGSSDLDWRNCCSSK